MNAEELTLEPDRRHMPSLPAGAPPAAQPAATVETGGLPGGLLLASLGEGGYVIPARRRLSDGLAGAVLVELAFRRRVGVDGGRLLVSDLAPTGDTIVDPVLASLAARRRAPDVGRCLEELSLDWTILGRAGQVLEGAGLVGIERRPLHPLLMHRFHPVPPSRAAALRARLGALAGGAWDDARPRDLALASLAATVGLLGTGRAGAAHAFPGRTDVLGAIDDRRMLELLSVVGTALVSAPHGAETPV